MSIHVLANHAHVFPADLNPNGTIERLFTLLDACNIEEAVCFAPFPQQWQRKECDANQWLSQQIATRPRLLALSICGAMIFPPRSNG